MRWPIVFAGALVAAGAVVVATEASGPPEPGGRTMTRSEKPVPRDPRVPKAAEAPPSSAVVPRDSSIGGSKVHLLSAGPADGRPVLLLHGMAFTSETWHRLGTIEWLAQHGFHVVAVDLPGFGASEPSRMARPDFLERLIDDLRLEKPVVLAASMSGAFVYPLLTSKPGLIGGLVAIAPAGTPGFTRRAATVSLPILVVWGENDRIFPVGQGRALASAMSGAELLVMPGAGHACYLEDPVAFHDRLLEFLERIGG